MKVRNLFDHITERAARDAAQRISRRSMFARLGAILVGTAAIPVLPVARGNARADTPVEEGSAESCDYWRHCAIDGFLCGCCGGSTTACPPGTEKSPITWIGTCMNPADGKDYLISYNDCCGKSGCGRCFCHGNERETPVYMPTRSNDLNWCLGTTNIAYHCSLSVVIGVASDDW